MLSPVGYRPIRVNSNHGFPFYLLDMGLSYAVDARTVGDRSCFIYVIYIVLEVL